jgi:hypothetical protein
MKTAKPLSASFGLVSRPDRAGRSLAALIFVGLMAVAVTPASAADVTIKNPSMRLIIKARPAAAYFTLQNDGAQTVQLTGATSSGCGMLMMHQSKTVNGVSSMSEVKSVTVPAHGSASFAPGGYHLMCMSPQATMVIGKSVPVTLTFADGKTVAADFPVQGPGGHAMSSDGHQMAPGGHAMDMPPGGH